MTQSFVYLAVSLSSLQDCATTSTFSKDPNLVDDSVSLKTKNDKSSNSEEYFFDILLFAYFKFLNSTIEQSEI